MCASCSAPTGSTDGLDSQRHTRSYTGRTDLKLGMFILIGAALLGTIGAALYLFALEDTAVARGRVLYDANCAACHGRNLEGQPDWRSSGPDGRVPAPPHDESGHTWHHSDTALIDYITLGGEEALARMGVSFDSAMPGFGDVLNTQDIADILAYIKSRWPDRSRQFQALQSENDDG